MPKLKKRPPQLNHRNLYLPLTKGFLLVLLTTLLMLVCSSMVNAQKDWTNKTGSPSPWYHSGGNWSPFGVPNASDVAQFNVDAQYDVWWSASTESIAPEVGFLNVTAGDLRFNNVGSISTQYQLQVNGTSGGGALSDFNVSGPNTKLTLRGIHLNSLGGRQITNGGTLTIDGAHGAGTRLTGTGIKGMSIEGDFNVLAGGIASIDAVSDLATSSGSTGNATVSGSGSHWVAGVIRAGYRGNGNVLVDAGGRVNTSSLTLATQLGSNGSVVVRGSTSQWDNATNINVGNSGTGELRVELGGKVNSSTLQLGTQSIGQGTVVVTGPGSSLYTTGSFTQIGRQGTGILNIADGGVVQSAFSEIGVENSSMGTVTIANPDSAWNVIGNLNIGVEGTANVNISDGGRLMVTGATIGEQAGSTGQVSLTGSSSRFDNSFVNIGRHGNGTLTIDEGAHVESGIASFIARENGSTGSLQMFNGGTWDVGSLIAGRNGNASINIRLGAELSNLTVYGGDLGGNVNATVANGQAKWQISQDLNWGGESFRPGSATLNIASEGLVTVGGTTRINATGMVNVTGGRFEFGQTTLDEFNSINQVRGSMAGLVHSVGYRGLSSLTQFQGMPVDLSDVQISNQGVLHGSGFVDAGLANQLGGELRMLDNDWSRFAGNNNSNAGEINNFAGVVEFENGITNQAGGFVSGRGQFIANGGWTNQGVMAFSGGPADVLGDVDNQSGGRIVTAGGATTTFYDDVVHNGTEIHTAAGSNTVFFGNQSGAGAFTGTGTVFYVGDLRPGNSPAAVSYEGSVVLGSTVETFIELAGMDVGEFDQFLIGGDLELDGSLEVQLIDGFQLSYNDEFLIAEVGGDLSGQFAGLNEGALVGNFGGHDVFISYSAGDGNDVGLFTAIPEPGTGGFLLFTLIGLAAACRRRKRDSI